MAKCGFEAAQSGRAAAQSSSQAAATLQQVFGIPLHEGAFWGKEMQARAGPGAGNPKAEGRKKGEDRELNFGLNFRQSTLNFQHRSEMPAGTPAQSAGETPAPHKHELPKSRRLNQPPQRLGARGLNPGEGLPLRGNEGPSHHPMRRGGIHPLFGFRTQIKSRRGRPRRLRNWGRRGRRPYRKTSARNYFLARRFLPIFFGAVRRLI